MIGRRELLGWVVAAIMSVGYFTVDFDPYPYTDVDVIGVEQVTDGIEFSANFEKTGCVFERLAVVSSFLGETRFLEWIDLDGLGSDRDRNAGSQTLRINIEGPESGFDWIELRTRHDCDGVRVDKVFYPITLADITPA